MNNMKNRVMLIGHVGMDPQLVEFGENKKLVKFSLATSDGYRNNKGEWVNETIWHNIVAWGKLAETLSSKLKKGTELALEGRINNRSYEDKNGQKKYFSEILMSDFLTLREK